MSADPIQTDAGPVLPTIRPHDLPYDEAFNAILANAAKQQGAGAPARERGFVVLARDARSLQSLQALCHEQQYNRCFTARYHLRSGPLLGTLMTAIAADIQRLRSSRDGSESLPGDFLPQIESGGGLASSEWVQVLRSSAMDGLFRRWDTRVLIGGGGLRREWLDSFFGALADPETLRVGDRLVLFCEVEGDPGPELEWERLLEAMQEMPERLGLVLSGAPSDFQLPRDDVHFAEVSLKDAKPSAASEVHYRYSDSALAGDDAAERDFLGVSRYAEGLARLTLMPETQPLTIGIHAPWGGGKSSFMNFIRYALVRNIVESMADLRPLRSRVVGLVGSAHRSVRVLFRVAFAFWLATARLSSNRRRAARLLEALKEVEEKIARGPGASAEGHVTELAASPSPRVLDDSRRKLVKGLEKLAEQRVLTVQFDAWRYENASQIWAGIAQTITARLERAMSWPARMRLRVAYSIHERPAEFWIRFVLPAGLAVLAFLASISLGGRIEGAGSKSMLSVVVPVGSGLATALFVLWRVHKVILSVSDRVLEYVRGPDYRSEMGYQHRVMDDLEFLCRRLKPRRSGLSALRGGGIDGPRVVVFIDNLDRCSDEKVADVLSAIHLILGASDFFVFLGIDTKMVHEAIARLRGYEPNEDHGKQYARDYLRKIIQLSFQLPQTAVDRRAFFIAQLFSAEARHEAGMHGNSAASTGSSPAGTPLPETVRKSPTVTWFPADLALVSSPRVQNLMEVQDSKEELDAFGEMQEFICSNPRELKRLVNVHRLVKILLWRPEAPPQAAEQKKLVHWLVFCTRWPEFVVEVLKKAEAATADESDCIAEVANGHADDPLRDFVQRLAAAPLRARDLKPGSTLDRAAWISRVVAEEPPEPARRRDSAVPERA